MIDESTAPVLSERPETAVELRQTPVHEVLRDAWLLAQRSEHTRAAYRSDIDQWLTWCGWQRIDPLRAVRVHVDSYREFLSGQQPGRYASRSNYSAVTIARKLTTWTARRC